MKKRTIQLSLLSAIMFASCSSDSEFEPKPLALTRGESEIVKGSTDYSVKVFSELQKNPQMQDKNIVLSPLSLTYALGMLSNGSASEARKAFVDLLAPPGGDLDDVNSTQLKLLKSLPGCDSKVNLTLANSVWVDDVFPVKQDFVTINSEYYNAASRNIDLFSDGCVDVINKWVSDNTNGMIDRIYTQAPKVSMLIANALYFNAPWKYEFKKENTKKGDFELESGQKVKVDFMNEPEASCDYAATENFKAVGLDYGNSLFRMVLLLPEEDGELTAGTLASVRANLKKAVLRLSVPKFKVNAKTVLTDALVGSGLQRAMNPEKGDYSAMSDVDLEFVNIRQDMALDVCEKGTEAAAVTVVEGFTSPGPRTEFTVDRPFYFIIEEKASQTILFMGKIVSPEYN